MSASPSSRCTKPWPSRWPETVPSNSARRLAAWLLGEWLVLISHLFHWGVKPWPRPAQH